MSTNEQHCTICERKRGRLQRVPIGHTSRRLFCARCLRDIAAFLAGEAARMETDRMLHALEQAEVTAAGTRTFRNLRQYVPPQRDKGHTPDAPRASVLKPRRGRDGDNER